MLDRDLHPSMMTRMITRWGTNLWEFSCRRDGVEVRDESNPFVRIDRNLNLGQKVSAAGFATVFCAAAGGFVVTCAGAKRLGFAKEDFDELLSVDPFLRKVSVKIKPFSERTNRFLEDWLGSVVKNVHQEEFLLLERCVDDVARTHGFDCAMDLFKGSEHDLGRIIKTLDFVGFDQYEDSSVRDCLEVLQMRYDGVGETIYSRNRNVYEHADYV